MATLTITAARSVRSRTDDPRRGPRSGVLDIPTLCWYPKLPVVGNCRICLVSVEGQAKLLPACATRWADGMVVQTESHGAAKPQGRAAAAAERYPGEHLRNGPGSPRTSSEEYVVRYGVVPTPLGERDLLLRHGDERPGDSMIRQRHEQTCILCTRCVRRARTSRWSRAGLGQRESTPRSSSSGRRPGQGGMHVVRRVACASADGRDLRGDAARRSHRSKSVTQKKTVGSVAVLRRRVPGDAPRRRRQGHPVTSPTSSSNAEPGLDLR